MHVLNSWYHEGTRNLLFQACMTSVKSILAIYIRSYTVTYIHIAYIHSDMQVQFKLCNLHAIRSTLLHQ